MQINTGVMTVILLAAILAFLIYVTISDSVTF